MQQRFCLARVSKQARVSSKQAQRTDSSNGSCFFKFPKWSFFGLFGVPVPFLPPWPKTNICPLKPFS